MTSRLLLDGSWGEGGGQILRTALSIAAVTGRPFRLERIRVGRKRPGLAPQHSSAVRAVASICNARVVGDTLGSQTLEFTPQARPRAAEYTIDVTDARPDGSAGAVTLVLQAMLLPLAMARGSSRVILRGGTHAPWSPSFDYLRDAYLPALATMGIEAHAELRKVGWYPAGGGEVRVTIAGGVERITPIDCCIRGEFLWVHGRALTSHVADHVGQRMMEHASRLLADAAIDAKIEVERVDSTCAGAGIFLTTDYAHTRGGFAALGARGVSAEAVAEEVSRAVLRHLRSEAAFDEHLADQLLLPAAFAAGRSQLTIERATPHFATNAWVLERFGIAHVEVDERGDQPPLVSVIPSSTRDALDLPRQAWS